MEGSDWLLLVVAIVVIAALAAALAAASRQRKSKQVDQAESIRQDAGDRSTVVRQQESKATEMDANARAAQAEAEAKAAEADRLAAAADRQQAQASGQRSDVDEDFRRADEVDPRSATRQGEGTTDTGNSGGRSPRDDPHTGDTYRGDNPR